MADSARANAGKRAWASKTPAEKRAALARLASGRRKNLTNHEAAVIGGLVERQTKKNKAVGRKLAKARKAKRAGLAVPASRLLAHDPSANTDGSNIRNALRSNLTPKETKALKDLQAADSRRRSSSSRKRKATVSKRKASSAKPKRSAKQRAATRALHAFNAAARAGTKTKTKTKTKSKGRKSHNIPRKNMYIARANGEHLDGLETRANGRRRRGKGRKHARHNMYVRPNGMEKMKVGLALLGMGLGSFILTNVAVHYADQIDAIKGPIVEYGVPAALIGLVWYGPLAKKLAGSARFGGRKAQIAITAGIAGSLINRALDNMLLKNLAGLGAEGGMLRSIGENTAAVLGGWPILEKTAALAGGIGEYVYDLPDGGVGDYQYLPYGGGVGAYIENQNLRAVQSAPAMGYYAHDANMQGTHTAPIPSHGVGYPSIEQRDANWQALEAAKLKATAPDAEGGSMFDDQFASAY